MLLFMMLAALSGEPETPVEPPAPVLRPSVVTVPDWLRRATGADAMRVYPRLALGRGVAGAAIIACTVEREGTLADCSIVDEGPSGQGFGDAALQLMPRFQMRPMTKDGLPVTGGKVRIPIRFVPQR